MSLTHKKYLIIGTGALGGFYGIKLSKAGFDVHFLARSDFEEVKQHGLKLESRSGDIVLGNVNCYNNPLDMPKGDIVLIAIKAFSNNELKNILPHVLHASSKVVMLQNGLNNEEYLTEFLDITRIYGGLSILAASKDRPGVIKHHDFGSIKIGRYNPDGKPVVISRDLEDIVADFTRAGISALAVPDLLQARWEKLVWNVPFSGLSVLLDTDTRGIVSDPNSLELAQSIIHDVSSAAAACGKTIDPDFQQKMIDITITMSPYFPSMKYDYDSGKPIESEEIFGNPLRAAQNAGCHAPYISMLYHSLKFLERNR